MSTPCQAKKKAKKEKDKAEADAKKKEKQAAEKAKKAAEKAKTKETADNKRHNSCVNTLATKYISAFESVHVSLLQANAFTASKPDAFAPDLVSDLKNMQDWVQAALNDAKTKQRESHRAKDGKEKVDDLSFTSADMKDKAAKAKDLLKSFQASAKSAA